VTELLIVSKPRGRIFKWIYGQYKEYLTPISFDKGSFANPLSIIATGSYYDIWGVDNATIDSKKHAAQRFKTPSPQTIDSEIRLKSVTLSLRADPNYPPSSGTIKVELWSDGDGKPGLKIADIGSMPATELTDSFAEYTFPTSTSLSPGAYYWVYIYLSGSSDIFHWQKATSDVYADGLAWLEGHDPSPNDLYLKVNYDSLRFQVDLDLIYDGAAEKRLEITFSGSQTVEGIEVNGRSVGAALTKEASIPQADNYTIILTISSGDVKGSIQRWLYYNKTTITLDDLNVSEAYLQEISFGSDGGVLRIDDDPAGDIAGSAGEKVVFTDILVPFRKLEWISGGGEVLILGVE